MDRLDVDYNRISYDKARAELGVGSQHSENVEFAAESGRVIAASYTDNDKSAFSGVERPNYRRLLADMTAGRIGSVTVWHANRLHRSTDEVNAFIKLARAHGVLLYSTSKGESYNLERASGRKQLRDDTSEAEYESEHRGERVALARKRQARNGDFCGGRRPYGWGVDSGRVRYVCTNPKAPSMDRIYEYRAVLDMTRHNETEAAEIRRWASELLSGVSMAQVLRDLADREVPTASVTDGWIVRRGGRPLPHNGWTSVTVRRILTNPRTSGHSVYRGQIVKRNALPPILAEETRQALITLLTDPARKTSPGNTPRWLGSLIYQCGNCLDGSVMFVRGNHHGHPIYRCRSKNHCSWQMEIVDTFVEGVLIRLLGREDVLPLLPRTENEVDITALHEERIALDARKRNAARRHALGNLDETMMDEIAATVDRRIAEIRSDLDTATAESPLSPFAESDDPEETYRSLSLGRKRELLRYMLTVTLMPIGSGHKPSRDLIRITKNQAPGKRAVA